MARGGLVYDDLLLVERNPPIRDLANLPRAFGAGFWDFADPSHAGSVGFYRPLVSAVLTAGWLLGGPAPWGYHLLSVAAHAAGTLLAWRVAVRLARSEGIGFAAALLFALHPIHTESVAWVSGVSDVACGVLFFGALLVHLRWRDRGERGAPWAAAPLALLALLSKEMGLALLPLLVVLDLAVPATAGRPPLARLRPLVRYLPVLLACLAYAALRVRAYGDWRAGFDRVQSHLGLVGPEAWRAWTLPFELGAKYLARLLWPDPLNAFEVLRVDRRPTDLAILAPLAACLAFAASLLVARRAGAAVLAGALAFAVVLLPAVARPESIGQFSFAERFAYLPSFGFCLALAALAARAFAARPLARLSPALPIAALAVVGGIYGARTHLRNRVYRDDRSFFEAARASSPHSATVRWSLGRIAAEEAQVERDPRRAAALWAAARAEFEAALSIDPKRWHVSVEDWVAAVLGNGWTYLAEGAPEVAEVHFRRVLESQRRAGIRESPDAHAGLGAVALARGEFAEAEREFGEAIRLDLSDPRARFNLGIAYQQRGDFAKAVDAFHEVLRLRPNDFLAAMHLGQSLQHLGLRAEAARWYERALEIDRAHPAAPLVIEALEYLRSGG